MTNELNAGYLNTFQYLFFYQITKASQQLIVNHKSSCVHFSTIIKKIRAVNNPCFRIL